MKNRISLIAVFLLAMGFLSSGSLEQEWDNHIANAQFDSSKQSYCFEESGKVFGKNIDMQVKPASVTKLYTTLWALDSLGSNFRFQTLFQIKNNILYISGGNDPYFVTENLILVMSHLENLGYNKLDKVVFSNDFFFNWTDKPARIKQILKKVLNTNLWDGQIRQSYNEANRVLETEADPNRLEVTEFSVSNVLFQTSFSLTNPEINFTFYSSPLWQHLKQVNMYSNNFYTDKIFDFLGGSQEFSDYIYRKINATEDDIFFYTGSGLGANYTTCRTTLNMLKELEEAILDQGLEISYVVAMPGYDEGTLRKRFTENIYRGKLAAKTGTLRDTSTLAGYLFNKDQHVYFGTFNHTSDKQTARGIQNKFIKSAIDTFQNIQQLNYQSPKYVSALNNLIQ
jgi:D-alanyl-D-alanine carboxypeptidase/D-alanyl-D-alanine-endopeptidase (penicillin-binding protein 4)